MNGRHARRIAALALALTATAVPAAAAGGGSTPAIAFRWLQMLDRSHGYALSGENPDRFRLLSTRDGGRERADVTPGGGKTRSDGGGRTWRRSLPFRDAHGQGAGQPFAVDEGAAAGSQGEALFASSDGGRSWRFVSATAWTRRSAGSLPFGCDKSGFGFSTPTRGWAGGYCAGGPPFF